MPFVGWSGTDRGRERIAVVSVDRAVVGRQPELAVSVPFHVAGLPVPAAVIGRVASWAEQVDQVVGGRLDVAFTW